MVVSMVGAPASDPAANRAWVINSIAGASFETAPTPTNTGVRGSREAGPEGPLTTSSDRAKRRQRRGIPPGPSLSHHPAHLTPGHRYGTEGQGLLSGPFGQVVMGLVWSVGPMLEPLPLHAHAGCEGVQLIVTVGYQVGPAVVDRSEPGRLTPVIEVDGHRRLPATALK
jgi:hypothetical protein